MESFTIDINEMLGESRERAKQQAIRNAGPTPILEVRLMELHSALDRYSAPCPFKVGDYVTPLKSSHLKHAGKPHVVIEVLKEPIRHWTGDSSMPEFGGKFDMRVVAYNDIHSIISWTSESWLFQKWTPDMENDSTN